MTEAVGLVCIVKDEEKVIERMLLSVARAGITDWVVVDTGSTDSTVRLVDHIAREYDTHLVTTVRPWTGFADAKNQSLDLTSNFDNVDYWLSLDADEEVFVTDGPFGTGDLLHVPLFNEGDGLSIQAARLIKHGSPLRFFGKVHEGLAPPPGTNWTAGRCESLRILSHSDGHRTLVPGLRNEQNYTLAMEELAEHPDSSRALFYAALSVEGIGRKAEAIDMFERRGQMHVPSPLAEEEAWYAQFRAAYLRATLGDHTAPHDLLLAYARRPWRTEPLAVLAFFWREQGYEALAQSSFPAKRPWPVQDWLFVDPTLYVPREEVTCPEPLSPS